nr:phage tail tip lysozyme [uncultured Actinoplanes sp.]
MYAVIAEVQREPLWRVVTDWPARTLAERQRYAMDRLVTTHGYPVNAAAGIVGNLTKESGVLPSRVQGSAARTPLRSRGVDGRMHDWTPREVMDRTATAGPEEAGVGLAQWTFPARRAALFAYHGAGPRILFDMDAQLDYLVRELRTSFGAVDAVLTRPGVTVAQASDEVLYGFETPADVLANGRRLPRGHAAVRKAFAERRIVSQGALRAYHPIGDTSAPRRPPS